MLWCAILFFSYDVIGFGLFCDAFGIHCTYPIIQTTTMLRPNIYPLQMKRTSANVPLQYCLVVCHVFVTLEFRFTLFVTIVQSDEEEESAIGKSSSSSPDLKLQRGSSAQGELSW